MESRSTGAARGAGSPGSDTADGRQLTSAQVTVVRGGHVLTMGAVGDVIDGAVAFGQLSGEILAVGDWVAVSAQFPGAHVVGDERDIVIPGFVNAHDHLSEGLISGIGETMCLNEWARRLIGAVAPHMNRDYAFAGARLKGAEMAMSGVTCVNDMFVHARPGSLASLGALDGLEDIGLRSVVSFGAADQQFDMPVAAALDEHFALEAHCLDSRLSNFRLGIAALHAQSDDLLRNSVIEGKRNGWAVHTHLAEVREELTQARIDYGTNTLGRASSFDLLSLDTIFAHCVWITEADIATMQSHQVSVSHNPLANMILGSGTCPVPRLRSAGIAVGLGTDGAASNDSHDMFQVLKMAALMQKLAYLDAAAMTARDAMRMATIEGARALGLDDAIGSLEVGKRADLCRIAGTGARMAYVHDPYQQLVYCAGPGDVADVWVDGRAVVSDHRLARVAESDVVAQARELAASLSAAANLSDVVARDVDHDRPPTRAAPLAKAFVPTTSSGA